MEGAGLRSLFLEGGGEARLEAGGDLLEGLFTLLGAFLGGLARLTGLRPLAGLLTLLGGDAAFGAM